MTLSDVIPVVQQLSSIEKRELIKLLIAELPNTQQIAPLQPFKTYCFHTPYQTVGAGKLLMQALQAATELND